MEFAKLNLSHLYILRVDPGEDVLASVEKFLAETRVQQAVILNGYGTLASYHLHWVTHNQIPTVNLFGKGEGGIEILGMSGLVVDGQPHIHISLATPEGAFGGHLEPGCRAYVVCEITFGVVEGIELSRQRVAVSVAGMGSGEVSRLQFTQI